MLPTPVRILTWNYDLLIERSFYEFCLDYNHVERILFEKHGVVHLNGHIGVEPLGPSTILPNDYRKFKVALFADTEDRFAEVIELFDRCIQFRPNKGLDTKIAFVWENSGIINVATGIAKGTTILIVVGSSFPFFNGM